MSKLICLDPGHGSNTPGKRTPVISDLGRSIKEYEFNKPVAYYLDQELKRCGFRTMFATLNDNDTPLSTRTSRANSAKANIYVSLHYNAGGGSGVETYHYPGSTNGRRLAQNIHSYVKGGTAQKDRGVKSANFHVLRETRMPAALVEYGFMDDPGLKEARLMLDEDFQRECARETAQGICKYFGVTYKGDAPQTPDKPPMRRVVADGKEVIDSSYTSKLLAAVEQSIKDGAREIVVKIR